MHKKGSKKLGFGGKNNICITLFVRTTVLKSIKAKWGVEEVSKRIKSVHN